MSVAAELKTESEIYSFLTKALLESSLFNIEHAGDITDAEKLKVPLYNTSIDSAVFVNIRPDPRYPFTLEDFFI